MKKRKGFTLIELLATIIVLSLVVGIILYVAVNVINRSKEKSYEVTVNEIEKNSNNYLLENNERLSFLTSDDGKYEYQCITVENLIDYGYLKNDIIDSNVSKDEKVALNDYIYIERDIDTKSITKALYTKTNPSYVGICSDAVLALGDITFTSKPNFNEWSKYKDVHITYKIYNVNDVREIEKYNYIYTYSGNHELINDNGDNKDIKVTSNGTLYAEIKYGDKTIVSKSIDITTVDEKEPVININTTSDLKATKQTITLNCTDDGVIDSYYFGTTMPDNNSNYKRVNNDNNVTINEDITAAGTYYLACKDSVGEVSEVKTLDFLSYTVNNRLETAAGTERTYTTSNYANSTTYTYIAPKGVTLTLASIYTIPNYSSSGRWAGVSTGAASGTSATVNKTAPTLDTNGVTYTMWFNRNRVIFRYKPNGGTITATTKSSDGANTYRWSTNSSGLIQSSTNGGTASLAGSTLRYGATSLDLYNWNNSTYLQIKRLGYAAQDNAQWICESGCKTSGKTFSHAQITINATDVCADSTLKKSECTVILKVNWRASQVRLKFHKNGGTWGKSSATDLTFNSNESLVRFYAAKNDYRAWNYNATINLPNWDYSKYINITKSGYHGKGGSEWCTGKSGNGNCYNDDTDYKNAGTGTGKNQFCDARYGDCTVTLYVNWEKDASSGGGGGGGSSGERVSYCCRMAYYNSFLECVAYCYY